MAEEYSNLHPSSGGEFFGLLDFLLFYDSNFCGGAIYFIFHLLCARGGVLNLIFVIRVLRKLVNSVPRVFFHFTYSSLLFRYMLC